MTARMNWPALLALLASVVVTASCALEREPRAPIGAPQATRGDELQVCADGPTVPGIDVSKWQGDIDWNAVAGSGVVFAFIRVSHGTEIIDEYFVDNWTEAESEGLLRGAYQYFSPTQDPIAQADVLLDALALHGAGELPPVIDVEETGDQTAATIADRVGQWLSHVEAELGVKPIIYTGSYFWNDNVQTTAYADNPLWIAHWGTTCPNLPTAWADWVFWQTSATGSVSGISGDVDLDVFNGDAAALAAFSVDPECQTDTSYQSCIGDVLRYCDVDTHLVSVDCSTSGQVCSMSTGEAACVDAACLDYLSGQDGSFCFDDDRRGECFDGQLTETSCGATGLVCESTGASAACATPTSSGDDAGTPDADTPDAGTADGGTGGGDTAPDVRPESPGLSRFAEVPESGLGDSHCQVAGRVPSTRWLAFFAAGFVVWMRRRAPAH